MLSILEHLRALASSLTDQEPPACREMLERLVHRITLRSGTLQILIKRAGLLGSPAVDNQIAIVPAEPLYELSVPFTLRRRGVEAKLVIGSPEVATGQIDERLRSLVISAHSQLHRLAGGQVGSVKDLALAERIDPSDVGRSLQVAFLAPDIVEAIVEGRQPVGLTAWQLRRIGYLPLSWEEQRRLLGFST